MRRLAVFIFLLVSLPAIAQQPLSKARRSGWQTLIYRIPADTAEKYIRKTVVYPDRYLSQTPFATALSDTFKAETLPVGTYLIVSTANNQLVTEVYCKSNLAAMPLNDRRRVLLEVRNERTGQYISNAVITVTGKSATYNEAAKAYRVTKRKPDDALIKVTVPGDTLLVDLVNNEDDPPRVWSQWWKNFGNGRAGKVVSWPVIKLKRVFAGSGKYRYRSNKNANAGTGYVLFNQPKYKPQDTVKLKAYILNRKWKPLKGTLDIYIQYYDKQYIDKKLATLKSTTDGAYIYEFLPGDSLPSDKQYTIVFKTAKGQRLLSGGFKIEDYVLDEVASYKLRADKEVYTRRDTLSIFAAAKDVNGLAVMDGRVKFYVLAGQINNWYTDREFVPDTLWRDEKPLDVNTETRFDFALDAIPAVDMRLELVAEFRNSNNELEVKRETVSFLHQQYAIEVKLEGKRLIAHYLKDGQSTPASGWVKKQERETTDVISFPYETDIDPYTSSYLFTTIAGDDRRVIRKTFEPESYQLIFNRIQQHDTAGFTLDNPNRIPVHYTILNNNKVVNYGADSAAVITGKIIIPTGKIYTLKWSYWWGGEERTGMQSLARLDKILQADISGASTIYPGQTDTLKVKVRDYLGRKAGNVNLTALSYNGQFGDNIRVPEPPYLRKYRWRGQILLGNYETEETGLILRHPLGKNTGWIKKLSLDTMAYYKLLFPEKPYRSEATLISDFTPQLAVYAVQKGIPQEIYLLYLNRQLAYYNGVTDKSVYAFPVAPGYVQIGIRLRNKYIQIDSVYMQPYYKQDIAFDLDNLPANAQVKEMPDAYTGNERLQIETSIWQLQNDSRTNNAFVWQRHKLVYIGYGRPHLIGPFLPGENLQYYKPDDFAFSFPFEVGYEYKLTPGIARLEKKSILGNEEKVNLPVVANTAWPLGDTIVAPPAMRLAAPRPRIARLRANDYSYRSSRNPDDNGKMLVKMPKDSSFQYGILYNLAEPDDPKIRRYDFNRYTQLKPGLYNLILVTPSGNFAVYNNLDIKPGGTLCVKVDSVRYDSTNTYVAALLRQYEVEDSMAVEYARREAAGKPKPEPQLILPGGSASIKGVVVDAKGHKPVFNASVYLKGYRGGTVTRDDGRFVIDSISPGKYILVVAAVGYITYERDVKIELVYTDNMTVSLEVSEGALDEVVVTGYGTQRRMSVTGAVSVVSSEQLLQGRIPGIDVGAPGSTSQITIRGISSINGNQKPLYVINGIMMEELPANMDLSNAQMNILKGEAAASLYGDRAANGVIVITTADFQTGIREKFRDYAFWQPNLITDENGEVSFTVTYPDNITGWHTYVVGMDKKRRIVKTGMFVKSFKPVLAQLSAPQFLTEGDSAVLIGKMINYTTDDVLLQTSFEWNGQNKNLHNTSLKANASVIEELPITIASADTVSARFEISTANGYSDGELRRIPVVRKGTVEAKGDFWALGKDTAFSFTPLADAAQVEIYAQNNTLDVLLDEIEKLKEYPYYCMEQTASKLTGLAMEQKIRATLKQPFKHEKEMQQLLNRLQKSQRFEGSWGWWQNGVTNAVITNYVTRALLPFRSQPLIETNVRNALLYLQNNLRLMDRYALLDALYTMSEAKHEGEYASWLAKIPFDSISLHQQWQMVKIEQAQQLPYKVHLASLMRKQIRTMLGGLHWGADSYNWSANAVASTVLAFKVLEKEKGYENELNAIIQYFLERRKSGRWTNTVESATIVSAILPRLLQQQKDFTSNASLEIQAGTTIRTTEFPFKTTITKPATPVDIRKSGGGLLYLTCYQRFFNTQPEPVTDKFQVASWFERSGRPVGELKAGESVILQVKVTVNEDADYVQLEIPIPAGCTYGNKPQNWINHAEYLKDKTVIFIERMAKGEHHFQLELEPRYSGVYHLNPVRAELMYFPTFFGRNEMKQTTIDK
jgi:TonB-dependent SusC/RagA subfamily outer membrane receptor